MVTTRRINQKTEGPQAPQPNGAALRRLSKPRAPHSMHPGSPAAADCVGSDGSVRSESPPGDSMTLVVGAAVAAACSEGQYGARAASSRCASAAGSASGRARGRLWPLACPGLARAWSESPGLRVTARQPASDAPTQLGLPGGGWRVE